MKKHEIELAQLPVAQLLQKAVESLPLLRHFRTCRHTPQIVEQVIRAAATQGYEANLAERFARSAQQFARFCCNCGHLPGGWAVSKGHAEIGERYAAGGGTALA